MYFVYLFLFSTFLLAQSNLLHFGDFEQWQENQPQGWCFIEPNDEIYTGCEAQIVFAGQYACKITFTTQDQAQTDFVHEITSVTAGQSYTLSVRVFEDDAAGRARFVIYWYDADTALISRQYLGSYSKDLPDWQAISKETIAIEGAAYACVGFRFYDVSDAWDGDCEIVIDSVAVSLTPTQPPEMLNWSPTYFKADTQLVICVQVLDDMGVDRVAVHYYLNGDSSLVNTVVLDSMKENIWQGMLPCQSNGTPLSYYFQITDRDTIKHTLISQPYNTVVGCCPLQLAETVDDRGCMCYAGYTVCASGVVTNASGTFSQDRHNEFLQDISGGINIYSRPEAGIIHPLSLYDSIMVWGQLYQYAGRGEILLDSIAVLKAQARVVKPIHLSSAIIDEDYEGCLVKVHGGKLINWIVQEDSSFYSQLETKGGIFHLYINRFTDINGMVNPGRIDSLVGIVSQYDTELPYTDGYFIIPRFRDDFFYTIITVSNFTETIAPQTVQLHHNFPNPFNSITRIEYRLPAVSEVELSIYNLLGQKIATLVAEKQQAGLHQVVFNACHLPSGIYFYQLTSDLGYVAIRKMIVCK